MRMRRAAPSRTASSHRTLLSHRLGYMVPAANRHSHQRRDGVSIATTSGRSEEGSLFGRAGLSGSSPSNPKEDAMVPAMPRNAPLTPMPAIASMITWDPWAYSTAACSRSPASPAEKPVAHPGISAGWVECENAASGVHKRAESLLVQGATHGDRSDVRAFVCQFRAGIQAVSAIVSRAYQQGHASILDGEILVVEQCHGHVGRPPKRPCASEARRRQAADVPARARYRSRKRCTVVSANGRRHRRCP